MQLNRWHTLVAALWLAVTCGFLYTFSTFSVALRTRFHLGPSDIVTIGTCQLAVGLVTITAGLIVDASSPRFAVVLGSLLNAGSWLVFGLIANGVLDLSSVTILFSLLAMTATYGGACVTAGVFTVLTKNFGKSRAQAIGIAKAWVGVASGLLTTVFVGFFPSTDDDPERLKYLWFLAGSCAFLGLAPTPLLRVLSATAREPDVLSQHSLRRMRALTMITLALVATTAADAAVQGKVSQGGRVFLSCALIVILAAPWAIFFLGCSRRAAPSGPVQSLEVGDNDREELSSSLTCRLAPQALSPWACGPLEMVRRPDAWLLWFAVFAMQSGGCMLSVNLGLITEARVGPPLSAATAVAAFSCAQSLGRLFGGTLSDQVVAWRAARPWALAFFNLIMGGAHGLLCLPGIGPFYCGVVLAGLSFGAMYPTIVVTIAELFGMERVASNYMLYDGSPAAFASILVVKYFVQYVYQAHMSAGSTACLGDDCFRLSHAAVAGLQLVAGLAVALLAVRSKVVYEVSVWQVSAASSREVRRHVEQQVDDADARVGASDRE